MVLHSVRMGSHLAGFIAPDQAYPPTYSPGPPLRLSMTFPKFSRPLLNYFSFLGVFKTTHEASSILRNESFGSTSRLLITDHRLQSLHRKLPFFLLLLSSCAPDLYWAKPGVSEGDFERDLQACREILVADVHYSETSFNPLSRGFTDEALAQCLNTKGWFLVEKP